MKKLSLFLFVLAMAFPINASGLARGDVNGDGNVSISDVTELINYLLVDEWSALPAGVHEYVDMGLLSGTLWATCNIGAINSEDYGDYFAWGETIPNKENYVWATTPFAYANENGIVCFTKYNTESSSGEVDNKTLLDPEDDAAYVNWGPEWRMPTADQIQELINQCEWTWITKNNVNGQLLTGPNGKTIFLPAAGQRYGVNLISVGSNGNYWSRELYYNTSGYQTNCAFELIFGSTSRQKINGMRNYGFSVRSVYVGEVDSTSDYERGDVNMDGQVSISDVTELINYLLTDEWPAPETIEEYVDLGLPTGTLWATRNVGANRPEQSGNYFAWGETTPKSNYVWATYQWVEMTGTSQMQYIKYNTKSNLGVVDNKTELDPEDDAAYVNWGPEWRMPSKAQVAELIDNCTWEWTEMNGVYGQKVIGPNGNYIFMPASGLASGNKFSNLGVRGQYWGRSLCIMGASTVIPGNGDGINFDSESVNNGGGGSRCNGATVRAVRVSE
ncbi:MAG: hypothetical protein IKX56_06805 [Muribaculaceae bacterium]|nr:hypothetical protein [Muribaculaceae bacterium]